MAFLVGPPWVLCWSLCSRGRSIWSPCWPDSAIQDSHLPTKRPILATLYALTTLILDKSARTTDCLFLAEPRRSVQKLNYWSQVKVSVDNGRKPGTRARDRIRSWRRETILHLLPNSSCLASPCLTIVIITPPLRSSKLAHRLAQGRAL